MYNIADLGVMTENELKVIAESMGIKKVDSLQQEELVYKILDQQASDFAATSSVEKKSKEPKAQKASKGKNNNKNNSTDQSSGNSPSTPNDAPKPSPPRASVERTVSRRGPSQRGFGCDRYNSGAE